MPSQNPSLAPFAPHPALVLGVYGEDLAHGARTAIFGSATLGLAEELALRGARLVHVYDTDASRVAEATARSHDRSIFYAPLPEGGDVGVRDGAFDFVVVPDLSLFADPASIVALVRRVVSPLGAALIASPNADVKAPLLPAGEPRHALGYYELYETIVAHFDSVRMIGQAPFVGYAVAELSVEDPEPTIDSSLAESEGKEPEWFVVLASDRNLRLDPFALIELPVHHFISSRVATADDLVVSAVPESGPSAAGTGTVLINILEAEREAALESLRQQEQALQAERFRADRVVQDLAAAREELDLLRERCRALGERVGDEEARSAALENRLEELRHDPEVAALRERLRALEERGRSLEGSARDAIGEHESEVAKLVGEHETEVGKLEVQLRERGREIQALRGEVERRERLVRELVMTNFPTGPEASRVAGSSGDNGSSEGSNGSAEVVSRPAEARENPPGVDPSLVADLSARLDRLASDAARREADLVGARWKIAQLERELMQQR